jgi:hypothetical protein
LVWACAALAGRRTLTKVPGSAETGGKPMAPYGYDDEDRLRANIAELEALLSGQPGLPPDARVTGLAALVNAKATLRLLDAAKIRVDTLRDEIAGPLAHALLVFSESAPELASGLRRLPEH